ncbi:conserved hypothetical protein [groundwater metagenome]|uniref:Ribonuclease H1 N-terminal domain-containing protein n=1 Tax=groundwater metagenome TaxID=717931 RepID=A0A098E937_9ZZZZ
MKKQKFYAYSVEGKTGITTDWLSCEKIIFGIPDAKFKGFLTEDEARRWLAAGADYNIKHLAAEKGIYFDSGTGAGRGVEINVTDEKGHCLLNKILSDSNINHRGHHWLFKDVTNNFGELLACKYALQIAIKEEIKKVFGDSNLILKFWSKGFANQEKLQPETIALIYEVKKLREDFERSGGKMDYIPGASNPADLGFHKG